MLVFYSFMLIMSMIIIPMPKRQRRKKYWFFRRYLDDGEEILHVAHKHLLVLKVASAKATFFGILVPTFLYWIFPAGAFFWAIWVIVGVGALIYHYLDWYFDVWLLTNVGIIDLEREGFFDFTSTRVDYHMIEGISYTVKGFLRTVFNYGVITVDKLGTQTSVSLEDAANPKMLERKVISYQEKYLKARSIRDHYQLKDMLSEMIAYHVQSNNVNSSND